ncbi:glycosyl transferase family 90 [Vibrio sp. FNV 38]|nr:glycosyl transferase family 90 [Vibrio sp. FNV 38]
MKLFYYLNYLKRVLTPQYLLQRKKNKLEEKFVAKAQYIDRRVAYYLKRQNKFELPETATSIAGFKHKGQSQYVIDLMSNMVFFPKNLHFLYHFGDETHQEMYPTIFKARPIGRESETSVLMKLVRYRHFRFVNDKKKFTEKLNMAVFRGAVSQAHRIRFMEKMASHQLMDAGQSNESETHPDWKKPFMSVEEQLNYKFIVCLEGNDVASNLKWAMSSNSVVITPKMKFETWFMEGTLESGVHYIEVNDDWSDFDEKVSYYIENPHEAEKIIKNAHAYITPFKDDDLEQLICIKTLERYFELSGQMKL